jgi:excisionase family DNA binding protein
MKKHLTTTELAGTIGTSPSTIKRWIDEGRLEASRTPGGHRRVDLSEAVRFIRDSSLSITSPEVLGMAEWSGGDDSRAAGRALYAAMVGGSAERVPGILVSLYLAGNSVASICDGPLAEAMAEIGQLWHQSTTGIYVEHRATDLAIAALGRIRSFLPDAAPGAPVAVGGAPAGDPYILPSLAAATVLASVGWREMNLGPDVPLDTMVEAARDTGARLVWLSVTAEQAEKAFFQKVRNLARELAGLGVTLVVGGGGLRGEMRGPNLWTGRSMAELAAYARGRLTAAA